MKKINWGILGCARIARDKVIPAILEAENANLYAISGRSQDKREEFREKFHPEVVYSSYDELLDDPGVDAVYIPLPNHLHCAWVKAAAEKKKHILCEKPLALNAGEVEEMIACAKKNGVVLAEAFAYLHGDSVALAKKMAAEGSLGELRHIDIRYQIMVKSMGMKLTDEIRYQPQCGGGVSYDLGCYAISFMRSVYGEEPAVVSAIGRKAGTGIDENVSLSLQFASGRTATAFLSFNTFYEQCRTVVGEKGSLILPSPFNYSGDTYYILTGPQGERKIPIHCSNHYRKEIEEFGVCILEGKKPEVDLEYSLKNAEAIDKLRKALGF
ncbi:MAG: Gfo/Idh/MocA family oxidoreductase [Clostridiales bacterium]|nr:Gfo/Idh/MocA family oxidoreductase [Clostridiales bacterium]